MKLHESSVYQKIEHDFCYYFKLIYEWTQLITSKYLFMGLFSNAIAQYLK